MVLFAFEAVRMSPGLILDYAEHLSYFGLAAFLTLLDAFTPFPEEVLLLLLGYMVSLGFFRPVIALGIAFMALLTGDSITFFLSRKGSERMLRAILRYPPETLDRYRGVLTQHIEKGLLLLRFIPGLRILGPLIGGTSGISYKKFVFYDAIAVFCYASLYFTIGFLLENRLNAALHELDLVRHAIFLGLLMVAVAFLLARIHRTLQQ